MTRPNVYILVISMLGLVFVFMVCAYLIGSFSTAILVSRWMHVSDPRELGSKNPGATNMLRLSGKKAAFFTLLGDFLKGFLPVLGAGLLGISGFSLALVGLAAFLGHLYPIFFGFKGGKGIATALGVFWGLSPVLGVVAVLGWLLAFLIFRYASLASLLAMMAALMLTLLMKVHYFLPMAVMVALVIWRHRENIERLKAGTERKTTFEKK